MKSISSVSGTSHGRCRSALDGAIGPVAGHDVDISGDSLPGGGR